ncbi:MAG: phosphatidate cytidylyltransferase [bacterium]|nr:phosphatidate cytidylyltransferase [bacterium]
MNNLVVRSITGALFVAVILGSILLDDLYATVVFGAFMVLGLVEFNKLFSSHRTIEINWQLGASVGLIIYVIAVLSLYRRVPVAAFTLIVPVILIMMLTELWRGKKNPILNSTIQIAGIFYIVLPFFLITEMNFDDHNFNDVRPTDGFFMPKVGGMFMLIWSNDTFAYLTGRLIGRTKLFERISPKKTWEGTLGGVVMTILVGFLIGTYFDTNESLGFWIGAALIIAPCAILGDLYESMFKRSLKIKDSGSILPGHGGILDRFDAVFFSVPFFMAWASIYPYL